MKLKKEQYPLGLYQWTAEGIGELPDEEVFEEAQRQAGFHPAGYGFWDFRILQRNVKWQVLWFSRQSCD